MNAYKIPSISKNTTGRRIAIGDIHGCYKTFRKLIETLNISTDDQVFLLGDMIDKGNDSKAVIDYTLELINNGFQIFPIKGNHEHALLIAYECGFDFFVEYLEKNNCDDFLDGDLEEYLLFFDKMEYVYDLDDFIVCHSEFLMDEESLYRGMRGLFNTIHFELENNFLKDKIQIVGHSVHTLPQIKRQLEENKRIFYLDSGCVYKDNEDLGFLSALDLDHWQLFFQKNIE